MSDYDWSENKRAFHDWLNERPPNDDLPSPSELTNNDADDREVEYDEEEQAAEIRRMLEDD